MSSRTGWVKAHRSLLDWEWMRNGHHFKVMMALILKANYEPSTYQGTFVDRGALIIGRELFASELGVSVQQLRTILGNLENTGEITINSSRKGTIIQVVGYDEYQDPTNELTSKLTRKPTPQITTLKEEKNIRSKNSTIRPTITPAANGGDLFEESTPTPDKPKKKKFVPPSREEFVAYAVETLPKKNPDWSPEQATRCADHQFETYVDQRWCDGNGKPVKNWKSKSINSMLHKKPWNFGNNPQSFLEQKKRAASSASPL